MAYNDYLQYGRANDAIPSGHYPNDHFNKLIAANKAILSMEKAKKEAGDREIAELIAEAKTNAEDLEEYRAQITTLNAQLQQALQLNNTNRIEISEAKLTVETVRRDLVWTKNQLEDAGVEIKRLGDESSSLSAQVVNLTADRNRNLAESTKLRAKCSEDARELGSIRKRLAEYESEDVVIHQITWGDKDLTHDGNVCHKVKEHVQKGWEITWSNDFFGCDPQPGKWKNGTVRVSHRRIFQGDEYWSRIGL